MIRELYVENFQSHEQTCLKFDPGVNAIIGESDSGKSGLLRALRWVFRNRPQGDAFRSDWGGVTRVRVDIDDKVIHKTRSDNLHTYSLFSPDLEQAITFKALRSEVPIEIMQALNIQEVNIQHQHDRPFLLDASPGEVATHFNRIAHLDIIDRGSQKIRKWIRSIATETDLDENRLERLEEELLQFDYLEEFEKQVAALEKLEKKKISLKDSQQKLLATTAAIKEIKGQLPEHEKLVSLEKLVDPVLVLFRQKAGMAVKISSLSKEINQAKQIAAELNYEKDHVVVLQNQFKKEFPDVCPLCDAPKDWYNQ